MAGEEDALVVLITWRDAHFDWEWDGSVRDDYLVRTYGELVNTDSDRFVTLAGERTPEGHRAVTHIPVENIVNREVLSNPRPKENATWTS